MRDLLINRLLEEQVSLKDGGENLMILSNSSTYCLLYIVPPCIP